MVSGRKRATKNCRASERASDASRRNNSSSLGHNKLSFADDNGREEESEVEVRVGCWDAWMLSGCRRM
jgi:hypothetical protein